MLDAPVTVGFGNLRLAVGQRDSVGEMSDHALNGWGTPDMVSPLRKVLVRTPTTVGDFVGDRAMARTRSRLVAEPARGVRQLLEGSGRGGLRR